jgi:hypothetical protein
MKCRVFGEDNSRNLKHICPIELHISLSKSPQSVCLREPTRTFGSDKVISLHSTLNNDGVISLPVISTSDNHGLISDWSWTASSEKTVCFVWHQIWAVKGEFGKSGYSSWQFHSNCLGLEGLMERGEFTAGICFQCWEYRDGWPWLKNEDCEDLTIHDNAEHWWGCEKSTKNMEFSRDETNSKFSEAVSFLFQNQSRWVFVIVISEVKVGNLEIVATSTPQKRKSLLVEFWENLREFWNDCRIELLEKWRRN